MFGDTLLNSERAGLVHVATVVYQTVGCCNRASMFWTVWHMEPRRHVTQATTTHYALNESTTDAPDDQSNKQQTNKINKRCSSDIRSLD